MIVNTWDIVQTTFIVWVVLGACVISLSWIAIAEIKNPKHRAWATVAAVVFWTVLVLIGGFLYYKNMEVKCMYDPGFTGPCLEERMS